MKIQNFDHHSSLQMACRRQSPFQSFLPSCLVFVDSDLIIRLIFINIRGNHCATLANHLILHRRIRFSRASLGVRFGRAESCSLSCLSGSRLLHNWYCWYKPFRTPLPIGRSALSPLSTEYLTVQALSHTYAPFRKTMPIPNSVYCE